CWRRQQSRMRQAMRSTRRRKLTQPRPLRAADAATETAMPPAEMTGPRDDVVATEAQPQGGPQAGDDAKASDLGELIRSMEVAAPVPPSDAGDTPETPQQTHPPPPPHITPALP